VWKREPAFFYSKGEYMERIGDEQKMTLLEISQLLQRDESTLRKIGKELFPEAFQNGVKTFLTESQVTAIKLSLGKNSELPKTQLEKHLIIQQAMMLQQEIISDLQSQLADAQPKIAFHDAVTGSKDTIDIGEAAKVLAVKGFGRNNLFERLRNEGILMQNNQPYQKYIDAGYFRTIESSFTAPDGTTHVNIKTVVYQKGLDYISKVITK
jgi:phage antirepressor YoqD-like protein